MRTLKVFSFSNENKEQYEYGNKIILPINILKKLGDNEFDNIITYKITNIKNKKNTNCGVIEFTAKSGKCYIPNWMMSNLELENNDKVVLEKIELKKVEYIKIQPHKTQFIDLPEPKEILEHALKNYTCLTKNETIKIDCYGDDYLIDIIETRPEDAVCIIDTDCEVEFMTPKDYVEPEITKPVNKSRRVGLIKKEDKVEEEKLKFIPFSGKSHKL